MESQMSGGDHAVALIALLYLPVVITALLVALEVAARAGVPAAVSLRGAYLNSTPTVRLAALGMVMSATIHLALAPSHWDEDHVRAVLFALDGIALSGVAITALMLRLPAWRVAAVGLLSAEICAYLGYVVAGVEQLDAVGIATKLVELAVIGLVLAGPSDRVASGGSWLRQLASFKSNGGIARRNSPPGRRRRLGVPTTHGRNAGRHPALRS
jgi:hypothetical protein